MQDINFAQATKAELEAAGYTVTQKRSQLTKRTRKSLWGVKPSMNKGGRRAPATPKNAALDADGGTVQG